MANDYQRFEEKFIPVPESGCWLWVGATKPNGYGNFYMHGRHHGAHRASLVLHGRPLGRVVMHKCDTPACVNPDHLTVGTHQDNSRDMFNKGRGRPNPSNGERNPRALLTEENVRMIRASSEKTAALAKALGVSYHTVYHARRGWSWQEVA